MSADALRLDLAAQFDRVNADHEPVVITRSDGQAVAVLMSLQAFSSHEETRYLLRSPRNAERLLEAVEELDRTLPRPCWSAGTTGRPSCTGQAAQI